ncbi:hypothetical protein GN244_ATG07681 [Phytophthora infestans]|uniref:Uncharacterized protein n=1 Tax=Phytophthora infestans TaxID=4787 RepID=A0A833SES6_PHYIN|nr:hypothetical protein GN244_ATG07681 [Phytophthora infestans]
MRTGFLSVAGPRSLLARFFLRSFDAGVVEDELLSLGFTTMTAACGLNAMENTMKETRYMRVTVDLKSGQRLGAVT